MKRKLLVGAAVLAVALMLAVPALARTSNSARRAPAKDFAAVGAVQHVIRTAGAVRLHVDLGSRAVKPFIGGSLVVRVAAHARILMVSDGVAHLITLSGVHAGDKVAVSGTVDRSDAQYPVYIAQTIKVVERTPVAKLTNFGCGGPLTAIDAQASPNTITLTVNSATRALWAQLGTSLTVVVTPQTQILQESGNTTTTITLAQVVLGEKAWVSGTIDRSQAQPVFSATKVTVHVLPTPTPTAAPTATPAAG